MATMKPEGLSPWSFTCLLLFIAISAGAAYAQTPSRLFSGVVLTHDNESVAGVSIIVRSSSGEQKTVADAYGAFRLIVPNESLRLRLEGMNIEPIERILDPGEPIENLKIRIKYVIPPIHESLVIVAKVLEPGVDRLDDQVFRKTLFSRDDQVFHILSAGINAGQHEGGGKSLEIRRFGFNLDHGGVNGGLKVLVDNFQQNQGTQGHGQGYLGQLKSLIPELVEEVDILNGPFSAEYGDFSGLGIVHIRLRESFPDVITVRLQGGSFDTFRGFFAYSPSLKKGNALVAYETSRTDGPFINPLGYKRDNVSGNFTRRLSNEQTLGIKFNFGRNDFTSSGQLPLDLVEAGLLDRFGFIDPAQGGRVRTGVSGLYYRKEWGGGHLLKLDGFVARSLFDLYNNFTYFLNDEVNGDEFQQHDSRLQEGVNAQYLHPYNLFNQRMLLTLGGSLHANQISVDLRNTVARNPIRVITKAHASVTNTAGYLQQGAGFFGGRLYMLGGLRFDYFRLAVDDELTPAFTGTEGAWRLQPKLNVAFTPSNRMPLTFYLNYGRGISSQDARGVVQMPEGEKIATTDFYQLGMSYSEKRFSLSSDLFFIDRSNEQVYIPDDGSIEFLGPSRSYGFEVKTSVSLTRVLALSGGLTRVGNAYFRGTLPRIYLDRAPHLVSNAALTLMDWRGFTGSLRYRHTNSYRLDGEDPALRASGFDLLDFSMAKRISRWLDFNLSIDNLTDKRYFETQNYFESRPIPGGPIAARIHATPGYPIGVTAGLTFHLLGK